MCVCVWDVITVVITLHVSIRPAVCESLCLLEKKSEIVLNQPTACLVEVFPLTQRFNDLILKYITPG